MSWLQRPEVDEAEEIPEPRGSDPETDMEKAQARRDCHGPFKRPDCRVCGEAEYQRIVEKVQAVREDRIAPGELRAVDNFTDEELDGLDAGDPEVVCGGLQGIDTNSDEVES